ncbi:MAG: lysine 2,3-aminomutase [Bacteroidota bacterium]
MIKQKKYKSYLLHNFENIPQVKNYLSDTDQHAIRVVGSVLPFKVNNYVIDELIDWNDIPNDPIYQLTFPQVGMLKKHHFNAVAQARKMKNGAKEEIANKIRLELNPDPAKQNKYNIPVLEGTKLTGIQHKYDQTVLFFPSHGQTCHAYCTFCFRWPQFVGLDELKFASRETELLVKYIKENPKVSDVLFTGGDPMVMSASRLESYIRPLINSNIPNLQTIRIGTKALSYWPYRFVTDKDADNLLHLFEKVVKKGYHLAFMAHFNHPRELETPIVQKAIKRILNTGAKIRTQSPIMKHINDKAEVWSDMWCKQVKLGLIPYYMFIARDTGAQDYFAVTLENAWRTFRKAYQSVSGIARTVKGPSMSAAPGKVHILGINDINGEKVFTLQFLQGRNKNWVGKPFFAEYNPKAIWLNDLKPAFGEEKFFFEQKYK